MTATEVVELRRLLVLMRIDHKLGDWGGGGKGD